MSEKKQLFEQSQDKHRHAQQKRIAANTTSAQRLESLEQTLKFLHEAGIDYIANKLMTSGRAFYYLAKEVVQPMDISLGSQDRTSSTEASLNQ